MKLNGKVSGFNEFGKLLNELPRNVENRVLQKSTRAAMKSPLKAIRDAAPRHLDKQSPASKQYGTLRRNIRSVKLRRVEKGQKGQRIHTGNAFWGYIYEMGSRNQTARPWFAPAFRKMQEQILKTLGIEIGRGIEEEAQKAYRGGRK